MSGISANIFIILYTGSLMLFSPFVGSTMSYLFLFIGSFFLLITFIYTGEGIVVQRCWPTLIGVSFLASIIISVVPNYSAMGVFNVIIYTYFLLISILIVPRLIPPVNFAHLIILTSVVGVLSWLGSLFYFNGTQTVHILFFDPRSTVLLESIFNTPRIVGIISLIGIIYSVIFFTIFGKNFYMYTAAICAFGLYFSYSRAAIASGIVCGSLYVIHKKFNKPAHLLALFTGILLFAIWFSAAIQLISLSQVLIVDLTGRLQLWEAAVRQIVQKPLSGWGPIDTSTVIQSHLEGTRFFGLDVHNSYLRVTLIGGIFSGLLYVIFMIGVLVLSIKKSENVVQLSFSISLLSLIILQAFSSFTVLGASTPSLLTAIVCGYILTGVIYNNDNYPV